MVMATSLFLCTSSDENTRSERSKEPRDEETTKQRRSKSGKSNTQKKQPQRGLGVAQLERLRLQERWNKMTEIDQLQAHNHDCQIPLPSIGQQTGVSVPIAKFTPGNYDVRSISEQAFFFNHYKHRNGGFHDFGGVPGTRGTFPDQFQSDRYWIAVQEARFQSGNTFETAKELSSTQKKHCLFDRCEICTKKKRISGENIGYSGGSRSKNTEMMPIDDCDFLALNPGHNKNIDEDHSRDFGVRRGPWHTAGSSILNIDKEVEVVAIHRKGNMMGGSVLMEYEFFPCKGGRSTSSKESSVTEAEAVLVGEASPSSRTSTATTNFIDLSLKLSC